MFHRAGLLFSLLFIALITVVSINNRPAADDFYYLYCVPEKGIISCVSELYHGYSARWTAYTLAAAVIPVKWLFAIFPVICVLLISVVIASIIKTLSQRLDSFPLKNTDAFITGVMLCSAFFFSSFSIDESWFWMIQACTYAMSMAAQLMILYCLISEKRNWFLLMIASVFAGGSSESYALIVMASMVMLYVFRNRLNSKIFPEKHFRIKILLALTGCIVSFFIMISSKGNLVRYEALPHASVPELIWIILKTWVKSLLIKPFFVSPYYLLFALLAFISGRQIKIESGISLAQFLKGWKKPLALLPFIVLILILPATIVMSGPPPDRAMMQVSFTMTAFIVILSFDAGRKLNVLWFKISAVKIFTSASLLLLLIFHLVSQTIITHRYAKAFDNRISFLNKMKAKGNKVMITLEPLPESGMIYTAEISEYEVHFTNSFLKKYLELDFEIRKGKP